MKLTYIKAVLILTALLILAMFAVGRPRGRAQPRQTPLPPAKKNLFGPYIINCVIDGDTVILNTGDRVRMKGIDAPELHHPVVPAQRFGGESRDFLKTLAESKQCFLEYDSYDAVDMYGRALAYINIDGKDVNAEMLSRGYAYLYTFKPFSKRTEYASCEREARKKRRGLWNFDLKDGRISNLVNRYQALNDAGKAKLDDNFIELLKIFPAKGD